MWATHTQHAAREADVVVADHAVQRRGPTRVHLERVYLTHIVFKVVL